MHCGRVLANSAAYASCNFAVSRPTVQSLTAPAAVHSINLLPLSGSSTLLHTALTRLPLLTSALQSSPPQRGSQPCRSTAVLSPEALVEHVPTSAETARTIVDIVAHGALSTVGVEGIPLGTYTSYILDGEGQPILRLRADAVHTRNLLREPRCSLFVQPADLPARLLARVTLIGNVEAVIGESKTQAAELHRHLHGEGVGVDAPADSDLYYKLLVDQVFYVGGMGASAESLSKEVYCSATADPLRYAAPGLAAHLNAERGEDVLRIAAQAVGSRFEGLAGAQLLWVDRLGIYLYVQQLGRTGEVRRVRFVRPVADERDARSSLTMMAQIAWESERHYVPRPVPRAKDEADAIA